MERLRSRYPWINNEHRVFFELIEDKSSLFPDFMFITSRVYTRGLIFTALYFKGAVYVMLKYGTGEQPLLDILFPDISCIRKGAMLRIYDDNGPWLKLSVWQAQEARSNIPKIQLIHPVDV